MLHNEYQITSIPIGQIQDLQADWQSLEKGADMTYFQSYTWNRMLVQYAPHNNYWVEQVFVCVKRLTKIILIMPLCIVKHRYKLINLPGAYSFARYEWSDYVNCIYKEFDTKAFDAAIEFIRQKYNLSYFRFNNLPEQSASYQHIITTYRLQSDTKATCVALQLPDTIEQYQQMLSKSTKQNIRTAYNRMKKDAIEYSTLTWDTNINKFDCIKLRAQRSAIKAQKKPNSIQTWKTKLIEKYLLISFRQYIPITDDKVGKFMSFYTNRKLRAFFNYGDCTHNETTYVMAAGIDQNYAKYSPGLITMYEFILHAIANKNTKCIDFTRGTEFYKYALGGEEHYIHDVSFT